MKKHLANIITMTRIISCICMIFTETLSYPFYCFYIWCGFSDILDGFVARTLKITSSFGSKLDTISDLTLYTVMMIKILPYLRKGLNNYIWILIYAVITIRFLHYLFVFFLHKQLSSRHTIPNKITGAMMFALPFFCNNKYLPHYSLCVLAVAYFAMAEEIIYTIKTLNQGENHAV